MEKRRGFIYFSIFKKPRPGGDCTFQGDLIEHLEVSMYMYEERTEI